jgi:SAM-dependent methyltransferase
MPPIQRIRDRLLPKPMRKDLARWAARLSLRPRVGEVEFGDLRRLTPISDDWGFDRGEPIDRFYIRHFMERKSPAVRGRVLEIANNHLTSRFGGDRVTKCDVLHVSNNKPPVTIVADLSDGAGLPSNAFDCFILTQTLQLIYDAAAAVRTIHRILKPGGVALVTVPAITRISRYDMDHFGQYWCFTTKSAQRMFDEVFTPAGVEVRAFGNVFSAVAFLHGVAAEVLTSTELLQHDPDYEVLVTICARKIT